MWNKLDQTMALLAKECKQKNLANIEEQIEIQKQLLEEISAWYEQPEQDKYSSKISELAHELNTPIGVCLTVSSVLMNEAKTLKESFSSGIKRSELEQFIDKNLESNRILAFNLNRSKNLIKNYGSSVQNEEKKVKEVLNLRKFLHEVCESLQPKLTQYEHTVEINCSEQLKLATYFDTLSQTMTNLIINSIKHGFHDKKHGNIQISCTQRGKHIEIIYKDNGVGIAKEDLSKIFTKNFTTAKSKGGQGIGLHIVKKIVEKELNGSIEVTSTPGNGVLFKIELPNS